MQFKNWLKPTRIPDPPKATATRLDPTGKTMDILPTLKTELAKCYLNPADYEDLISAGGFKKVYEVLKKKHFPKDDKTKRGVFGETISMLWVRDVLGYEVPFLKRQWAMQRERPQLGEDVVGFVFPQSGKDKLMIVEAKFYASTKSNLEGAIDQAHKTITKCMKASQCYTLYHISTFFHYSGKDDLRKRVLAMFNHYKGKKFEKNSGVFVITSDALWTDSMFKEKMKGNTITDLNCWGVVHADINLLYEEVHK